MDVDSNDVDQILLQQFSCMGTTDRDELIKQLQFLIGNALNDTTAAFFLDMNNWNLQGAVCSYFDFEPPHILPSMMIVKDVTFNQSENIDVPPSTKFDRAWRLQNNGEVPWPSGVCLRCTSGANLCTAEPLPLMSTSVGCCADVRLEMCSPQQPGVYESSWRAATANGTFFGEVINMVVTVADGSCTAVMGQLTQHGELGARIDVDESSCNPFVNANTPSSHALFQDSVQQTQDTDVNMC